VKQLPAFSKKEREGLLAQVKSGNSTMARLILSFLAIIDEYDDTPARKEKLKTNFLFAVADAAFASRVTVGLAKELAAVAENLRAEGNPISSHVDALADAVGAQLSRGTAHERRRVISRRG
jgi:hypothetical protein